MKKIQKSARTARIWYLFMRLTPSQKRSLLNRMEKETREKRWDELTEKLSRRFQNSPISDQEITEIVEEVRQERHDRPNRS